MPVRSSFAQFPARRHTSQGLKTWAFGRVSANTHDVKAETNNALSPRNAPRTRKGSSLFPLETAARGLLPEHYDQDTSLFTQCTGYVLGANSAEKPRDLDEWARKIRPEVSRRRQLRVQDRERGSSRIATQYLPDGGWDKQMVCCKTRRPPPEWTSNR